MKLMIQINRWYVQDDVYSDEIEAKSATIKQLKSHLYNQDANQLYMEAAMYSQGSAKAYLKEVKEMDRALLREIKYVWLLIRRKERLPDQG